MKRMLTIATATSLLAGCCSTCPQHSRIWEYETVTGKVDQSQTDELAAKINAEISKGWEFVSSGGAGVFYGFAVLKREKK